MDNNKIKKTAVIILAAGLGKRMGSDLPKVLHKINNTLMIMSVCDAAINSVNADIIIVIGYKGEEVKKTVSQKYGEKKYNIKFAYQEKQLGTGHAVKCAAPYLSDNIENVVILYGDVPCLKTSTISELIHYHNSNQLDITVLGVKVKNPTGYGRLIMNSNTGLSAIVEEKDAGYEQKKINIINSGIYCINKNLLSDYIFKIKSNNVQQEFYLTDIIGIGYKEKKKIGAFIKDDNIEFMGINSIEDLKYVKAYINSGKKNQPFLS
ncbi:MAG: NTP transferase domain-containing protein [Deltaproteobacteria bacterium]|nr:NTP transferase domain-containing protein [Deltaproteobacteria bacterium]